MYVWLSSPTRTHICVYIQENHRQKCRLIRLGLSKLSIREVELLVHNDEDIPSISHSTTPVPLLQIENFQGNIYATMFVCLLDFV